ncbi:MAG: hypothetical protein NTV51_06860 [Verrucomicrobia bacterium]|nr:hypothetical protein [Verrucomicrobiota bacterium]
MSFQALQQRLPMVRAWIDHVLAAHAGKARPVADCGFARLGSYYSGSLLASAHVIVVEHVPTPPLMALGLEGFTEFERMDAAGITYLSSFFVRAGYEDDESLHFHELVHVVQWQHLGPERFITAYALGHLLSGGYRTNPLEVMAYDLQSKFDRGAPAFDVATTVVAELERVVPPLFQRAFGPGV